MKHAQNTLGSGNLRLAVQLPEGEDLNEWIAVNSKTTEKKTIFFNVFFSIDFSCRFFQSDQHALRNHH